MASGPPIGGEDGAREILRYSGDKVYRRKALKGPKKDTPSSTATTGTPKDLLASNPITGNENNENESRSLKENLSSDGAVLATQPQAPLPDDADLTQKEPKFQPEEANTMEQLPDPRPEVAKLTEQLSVSQPEEANSMQPFVSQPEETNSVQPLVSQPEDPNSTPIQPDFQPDKANATLPLSTPQPEASLGDRPLQQQQTSIPSISEPPSGNRVVEKMGLDGKMRINLASRSRHEVRELRKRLQGELDTVRTWVRRIEAKEGQIFGFSHSRDIENDVVDASVTRVHLDVVPVSAPPPPPPPPPPRGSRPLNQLSISVMDNSHGITESIEKEKRTPKANQFYRNSEFLLAKDRFPPADSNKKSKSNGKKKGGEHRGGPGVKFFKNCNALLEKLMKHQYGWVFNSPVDVNGLGLLDYYSIIKHPMDLGTVKMKLGTNKYMNMKEFADDVRLTFNNAMTYNPKGQDVHYMAETLLKIFEERWAAIESDYYQDMRLGFDSGTNLTSPVVRKPPPFLPPPIDVRRVLDRSQSMLYPSDLRPRPSSITPSGRTAAPKKPKAKDPHKREMTFDEKQKLSTNLQNLPSDKLDSIVQIIKKRNTALSQHDDEIEVDIDRVDTETLWELDRFVTNYKKSLSKNKRKAELAMQARLRAQMNAPDQDAAPRVMPISADTDAGQKIVSSSPVQVEKQGANSSRSSSSDSSSSDSGSSSSDSDSDSSSGSDSDAENLPRT
ncbi:hypothetical protein SAY87_020232 [Trapa incisa]|uniref:Transcription factor GTE4 n=1 Tax=Trapa incisa TaxID=236973 RepID=A0AAN7K697_9MYRT|nr:hypothetical protein SAY87_020232 [Trapa incisa]